MPYQLTLTVSEMRTLGWIADRYRSAQVLHDGMEGEENQRGMEGNFTVPESIAWEYRDALREETDQMVPPCAGGTLAEKLATLYEEIV